MAIEHTHHPDMTVEYGIASESRPDDIELLGVVGRVYATAVVADSREAWPDVYLVERVDGDTWQRSTP